MRYNDRLPSRVLCAFVVFLASCGSDAESTKQVASDGGTDVTADVTADVPLDAEGSDGGAEGGGVPDAAEDVTPPDTGSDAAPEAGDDCIVIKAEAFEINPHLGVVWSPVSPNFGEGAVDAVVVELWELAGFEQVNGTFDLAQGENAQLLTCNHCVRAYEDFDPFFGTFAREYFQASGSMTLTEVTSPVTLESVGSLSDVVLREITVDGGSSVPVPGGLCLRVEAAAWDTRVPLGSPCQFSADCGDEWSKVCDPATATCVLAECGQLEECAEPGTRCLAILNDFAGVCVPLCKPWGSPACPSGQQCLPVAFDDSDGFCMPVGPSQVGETCEMNDISSGCVAGSRCLWDGAPASCYQACEFWSSTPDCPSGSLCNYLGICDLPSPETAQVGEPCSGDDLMPDCASDGAGQRGVCISDWAVPNAPQVCRQYCRPSADDCGPGESCTLFNYHDTLGYCE